VILTLLHCVVVWVHEELVMDLLYMVCKTLEQMKGPLVHGSSACIVTWYSGHCLLLSIYSTGPNSASQEENLGLWPLPPCATRMTFDCRRIRRIDSSAVKGHMRCARGESLGTRLMFSYRWLNSSKWRVHSARNIVKDRARLGQFFENNSLVICMTDFGVFWWSDLHLFIKVLASFY